jgi:hypothetical protein
LLFDPVATWAAPLSAALQHVELAAEDDMESLNADGPCLGHAALSLSSFQEDGVRRIARPCGFVSSVAAAPVARFSGAYALRTIGAREECDDVIGTAICEALWIIYGELQQQGMGDCGWAAEELYDRLMNPVEGFAYYSGENYPAYMVKDPQTNEFEYKLRFGNKFWDYYNAGLGGQMIAHELVGHYHYDYSDQYMNSTNWGSECNFQYN